VSNFEATARYRLSRKSGLSVEQRRTFSELVENGIAITSATQFLEDSAVFDELVKSTGQLVEARKGDIEAARREVKRPGSKTFLVELLDSEPILDIESVYVRFCMQPEIIAFANAYFGMYTKFRFFNIWYNMQTELPPTQSQLWHRDPEDRLILKMFVYLTDVDEGAGPFTYAPGTHAYGAIDSEPQSFKEEFVVAPRSNDEQMAVIVPEEQWVVATGKRGAIVFADTNGYHKGGWCRESDRLLFAAMFTSKATTTGEYFKRAAPLPAKLPPDQKYALSIH